MPASGRTLNGATRLADHPAAVLVLIFAVGLFHAATLRQGHEWGGDFSLYIMHAANIAAGLPYGETGYIPDPYIGPQAYPPVFPILLAPVYGIWGLDLTAMKLLVAGLFLAALWFAYVVLRRESDARCALVAVALTGFNPWLWDFKDQVLSDVPFMAFVFLTLALAGRVLDGSRPIGRQLAWGVALGLSLYLTYATRSLGLLLVPAIGCAWLLGSRKNFASMAAMVAAFIALVLLHKLQFDSDGDYAAYFSFEFDIVIRQAIMMVVIFADYMDPGVATAWTIVTILGLGALAAIGFAIRVRRSIGLAECFTLIYPAPLFLFDNYLQYRYLIPLLPFFLLYVIEGAGWIGRRITRADGKVAVAALVAVVVAIYGIRYSTLGFGPIGTGIGRPESVALFDHVRRQTAPDDTIVFFKPRVMALMTGRRSASYYGYRDADELWGMIRRVGADHLVIEDLPEGTIYGTGPATLRGFVETCPECFAPAFSNERFEIYRIAAIPEDAGLNARAPVYRSRWRDE